MIVSEDLWFLRRCDLLIMIAQKICINKELWISCGEIHDCHMCRTGNIIIQARKITGEDEAFQVQAMLPLLKWIRLDYYIQDSEVKRQRMTLVVG